MRLGKTCVIIKIDVFRNLSVPVRTSVFPYHLYVTATTIALMVLTNLNPLVLVYRIQ